MQHKLNIIKDFSGNHEANIKAAGFHILNDNWMTEYNTHVFCPETGKTYKVLEYKEITLDVLKPKERQIPGIYLRDGFSNWETLKLACIKVENHDELKPGCLVEVKTYGVEQISEILNPNKCTCLHEIENELPRTMFCMIACRAQREILRERAKNENNESK
jgi:hypothetical protein